jgi:hypothetical protein
VPTDSELLTVFRVPLLRQNSVACGGCCPVPVEAVLLPELEMLPGVREASADWATAQVSVWHTPAAPADEMAALLAELSYPAESWDTRPAGASRSALE